MIDLTNWKLTDGRNKEYYPISSDIPPYFYNKTDSITFSVSPDDKTTSGSHYPRSELREMKGGKKAAWKPSQNRSLKATLAINELPVTISGKLGRIVIGQIHGKDNELCRLYYDNGKIYFYDDKAGSKKKETKFDLKNRLIPLNQPFAYSIEVINGKLRVIVAYEGEAFIAEEVIGSYWKNDALYFKAGVYCQVGRIGGEANTQGSGKATATFFNIVLG